MDTGQSDYEQLLSGFRDKLESHEKEVLDEVIAKLTIAHQAQIHELEEIYKRNVSIEVMAVKTTLEQVYIGKSQLEVSAAKVEHEEQMEEMKARMEKTYKENINSIMVDKQKGVVDPTLTDKYNQLIQKINQALDNKVLPQLESGQTGDKISDVDSLDCDHGFLNQEIRNLLMNQQEEISCLRSQVLGEYESVLQSRTQTVVKQTEEVSGLEEQLKELQTQYREQVNAFQQMLAAREDEQNRLSQEEKKKFEQQQEELKIQCEKKIMDMEEAFGQEINFIKEKYEEEMSSLVQAKLGSIGVDVDSNHSLNNGTSATDTAQRIKLLETELAERDLQLTELKRCLDHSAKNDGISNEEFRNRVEELEGELQQTKSMCSQLENVVEANRQVIENLEHEKKESEKLYRDLLEKESPRSKGSMARDYVSSDSVDDSFSSAREEIQDTPRSMDSPGFQADGMSDKRKGSKEKDKDDEEEEDNTSIPFANDSVEYNVGRDGNQNNNSQTLTVSNDVEQQIDNLKCHVEDLTKQLEEVKASEEKLRKQIDESQHEHLDVIEHLRQELEHEKQVEVETLQSEFKVQMEIELKRQAAELLRNHETNEATGSGLHQQTQADHSSPTNVNISDNKLFTTLETASDNILEASCSSQLLQTGSLEYQTVVLASVPLSNKDDVVDGNMSDDSKVTSIQSPITSPTHQSARSSMSSMQSLPLTDMEKEVQALRMEYESKITQLSSEIDRLNQDKSNMKEMEDRLNEAEAKYDRLMEGVQSGDHPELNELMKDKYGQELELVTSLMQQDFDETLKGEKKKLMEHHRKLMSSFMEDKDKEDDEAQSRHEEELKDLKQRLASEFETRVQGYEQEIERLNRDLDLLREATPRGSDEGSGDTTLPELEEIILPRQHQGVESASRGSAISPETSTPLKSSGVSYEESEEEETEAEKKTTLQVRSFADVVNAPSPSPSLNKEKEELELKVQQLTDQVERLTHQLTEGQAISLPGSPLHSSHDTTLKADETGILTMLQSDLERISTERESVQSTNDRLLSLLSDTVKTYIGVEDTINRKLTQVVSGTPRSHSQGGDSGDASRSNSVELDGGRPSSSGMGGDAQAGRHGSPAGDYFKGGSLDVDTSQDSHALENTSILSNATDEGLEISQRLAESIFVGPDLDAEGEEILSDARGRLTSAVEQLLELMEQSTIQLHEAKNTQEDLLANLAARANDVELSQSRSSELGSQLASEIEAKEYLGLELHKAEGLISGYAADRETNEKQIQNLEEEREALIVELDSTRTRLEVFERSQSEIDATREELTHQQTLLRENVGQETQALLNEVSNLNQERRELSTQLQHQLDLSRKRLSEMETLAEEAERKHEAMVEEKNQALEDIVLQLENAERQLKSSKAFVDELLVEREQEREEHQRDIEKMKATIEGKDRSANSQERMQREIADLTEQLHARITNQTAMHQRITDLQKILEDKELSANDLKVWVNQLEGELDQKFSEEDQLKDRISKLERQLTEQSEGNVELDERNNATLTPRSEVDSGDSSGDGSTTEVRHRADSVVSLEEELQKSKETKEEMDVENKTLKQQLHDQMLQISGLKNQIDQMRHYATADDCDAVQLRETLAKQRDLLEAKETELSESERKIEDLESILHKKQLEAEELSSKVSRILEMGDAQEENDRLRNEVKELRSQVSVVSDPTIQLSIPASLLEEKNEEISELKTKLQGYESPVDHTTVRMADTQDTILELQKQLKERDEEIIDLQDSLASARRGEACLDMSLPMTEELNSMLNISMTGRTTRSQRAYTPPTSIQQEFEETIARREGEVNSLEEEIKMLKKDLEQKTEDLKEAEKLKSALEEKDQEVQMLQKKLLVVAKESDEMKVKVEGLQVEKDNQTDQQKIVSSLEESVEQKDSEIYQLTLEIEELKGQLEEACQATEAMEKVINDTETQLTKTQEDRDEKREQLEEKEHKLDQMMIQIDGLQTEITALTNFQTELQKDYDTIQTMMDEKEKVLETLTQELTDTKSQQEVLDSMGSVKADLDSSELNLKQALEALESEKKVCAELQEVVSQEKANVEELKKDIEHITKEHQSAANELIEREKMIGEKERVLNKQGDGSRNVEKEIQRYKNIITSLEEAMNINKENSNQELLLMIEESDKMKIDHETKVKDLETQLQLQEASLAAMKNASRDELNQSKESVISQLKAKDIELEELKMQLNNLEEEKNIDIMSLKDQLNKQQDELAEAINLQRQLDEVEEQLRWRQSALLDVQAENEKLSEQLASKCVDDSKKLLEEKNVQIIELEDQLRLRQTLLLELETAMDRILDEKTEIQQKLLEKEEKLEILQFKVKDSKDEVSEEFIEVEDAVQISSAAALQSSAPENNEHNTGSEEVAKLKSKLTEATKELDCRDNRIRDVETEVARKDNELEVRKSTIHDLLNEIETLRSERMLIQEFKEVELNQLQSKLKDAESKAKEEAKNAKNLRKTLMMKEGIEEELDSEEEEVDEEFVHIEMDTGLMASAPVFDSNVESKKQQEIVDRLYMEIQEKNKDVSKLTNEIDSLKTQIEKQEEVILSLKDELEISGATHEEQILSRDNQITELQETIRSLKHHPSIDKVQMSESNALSPKTKEQISTLKTQLRKAHAALEEMQTNDGNQATGVRDERDIDEVDSGTSTQKAELESLRRMVQEQEDELFMLKSQHSDSKPELVMEEILKSERSALIESHQSDLEKLKQLHDKEMDVLRQEFMGRATVQQSSSSYSMNNSTFGSSQSNIDGVPPRIQALLDRLHNLGEDLLSASDFEYLQSHLFRYPMDDSDSYVWSRERTALMDTIVAVKELLQQTDRLAAKSVEELPGTGDWRGDLLESLVQVFQKEKQVLREEIVTANSVYPEIDIMMKLESRINDLEYVHQNGLDEMLKADRQSLLDEVDNLHHRLLEARAELQSTRDSLDERISQLEKAKSNAERKLERQIQMLEYKIQQEGVIQEDLKKSLTLERQRVSELSSESSHDRSKVTELQSELSCTQIQLSKVRDALEREQHRFNSVTDALEEEQAKTSHLMEQLDSTKKKLRDVKTEAEHSHIMHQHASDSDTALLEEELEREKQKNSEYADSEKQAQKQLNQLSEKLETVKMKLNSTREKYETQIEQLHRDWMEKEIELKKERDTESVSKLADLLNVERVSHQQALDVEKRTVRELKKDLFEVKNENEKLLCMYEAEKSRADKLRKSSENKSSSNDMLRHLMSTEREASQLQEKVGELEEELSRVQERASALESELHRSSGGVKTSQHEPMDHHREALSSLMTATVMDEEMKVRLAQCCTRLQLIASKLQGMTGQASQGSVQDDEVDGLDGAVSLRVVMDELERLKASIREREERRQNALEDPTVHSDQLLLHNKQLAEHVKKLKMEKEQLATALKAVESQKENIKTKLSLPQYISDVTSDEEGVYDRTVWASEKLSLQMALDSAEHEIQHLRSELKRFSSLTKFDGQQLKMDPDKTQRLYGKYLRAESFRKALIYQKKYLILLLGGYRDTEQETLAILASMGSFPSPRSSRNNHSSTQSSPLANFRSVGRAIIAIFRMRYLVKKWKRATRVGSPVVTGQITAQHAYIPNSSSYSSPNSRQPQQVHKSHNRRYNNPSFTSLSSSTSSSLLPSTATATMAHSNSPRISNSDYLESLSLTNGGAVSSLAYSQINNHSNNIGSLPNPAMSSASSINSHHHPNDHPNHHRAHQQVPLYHSSSAPTNYSTTPPTKESGIAHNHKAARGNPDRARRQILQDATSDSDSLSSQGNLRPPPRRGNNDDGFMKYLENVQQRLTEDSTPLRKISWR